MWLQAEQRFTRHDLDDHGGFDVCDEGHCRRCQGIA
jgi:hypothetical protein